MMFPFALSTSKFGATLGDFMFGKTVKAQVILFYNVQPSLVVCYSGTLMGYVRFLQNTHDGGNLGLLL